MRMNDNLNKCSNERNLTRKWCTKVTKCALVSVLVVTLILNLWQTVTVEASESVHNRLMRVGLLFNQGSHQEAVPFVTLSAPTGLVISQKGIHAIAPLWNTFPQEELVFHVDQYYVLVAETTDLQHAKTIDTNLKASNYQSVIVEENLLVSTRYQVVVGYYNSLGEAESVGAKIRNETTHVPIVRGNYRVQAGVYTDKGNADQAVSDFRKVGFAAYVAVAIQDGSLVYKVLLGNEVSAAKRDELREHAKIAFTGQEFINASGLDYLLVKRVQVSGKAMQSVSFPPNQAQLIVKAVDQGGVPFVKINERFSRHYRGVIELSSHNQKLAVINELPMDQYLYGVVPREMASGWPMEALKAQAVIARTFALGRNGWGIAHVVDDVKDQAYWGYSIEAQDTNQAVDQTRGQLLRTSNGGLAQTFYSSNAGGMSAKGTEVWGNDISYIQSVPSPYDAAVLDRVSKWYRVMLSNGTYGYIHSNYIVRTGEFNSAGFEKGNVNGQEVNVRANADIYHTSLTKVSSGASVVIIEEVHENNAYKWSKGPYTAIDIRNMINANQRSTNPILHNPVLTLTISKKGESGRVMEVKANGNVVPVSSPDAHRSLFREGSSLRSTKFEIEGRGEYSVLGAEGKLVSYPQSDSPANLYVVDKTSVASTNVKPVQVAGSANEFMIMNTHGEPRVATKRQEFVFNGYGFGHGFGLSQWGAYGMAIMRDASGNLVYTYADILSHYYSSQVYLTPVE